MGRELRSSEKRSNVGGSLTTGLSNGARFIKDNRLLPRGFDKDTAEQDIAVVGAARADADFSAGGDHVRYSVDVAGGNGPFAVDVELCYQPVGFRWAENLKRFDAAETRRFAGYYDAMASASAEVLARGSVTIR